MTLGHRHTIYIRGGGEYLYTTLIGKAKRADRARQWDNASGAARQQLNSNGCAF